MARRTVSAVCKLCGAPFDRPADLGRIPPYCPRCRPPKPAAATGPVSAPAPKTPDAGYDPEELDFLKAVERYKRTRRRPFPSLSEILAVARSMGYRKVAEPEEPKS